MIATALVFALGALVASFIALVFAPVLWSNAQRLARREFQASIPTSVREMQGEIDAARARAAFEMRKDALHQRAAHEKAVRERAEAGRAILENGQLLARQADLTRQIEEGSGRTRRLEEELKALIAERDALLAVRQDLGMRLDRREAELAGLSVKHQALSERFDEQRFRLASAEARLADLAAPLRAQTTGAASLPPAAASPAGQTTTVAVAPTSKSGNETPLPPPTSAPATDAKGAAPSTGSSRLRAAIARTGGAKPTNADHAEIRERIGDIAARVIHDRIKVEGKDSSLARIIAEAPPAQGGEPLLADRVRRLQADEAPVKAAAQTPNGAGRPRRKSRR